MDRNRNFGAGMRTKSGKSKKVEQGDATRDSLLLAARQLFGSQGFAATSLDEIVCSAGVTKGALYHHFSGKQELFFHVFKAVRQELSLQVFPIAVEHNDIWSDLILRCRNFVE